MLSGTFSLPQPLALHPEVKGHGYFFWFHTGLYDPSLSQHPFTVHCFVQLFRSTDAIVYIQACFIPSSGLGALPKCQYLRNLNSVTKLCPCLCGFSSRRSSTFRLTAIYIAPL